MTNRINHRQARVATLLHRILAQALATRAKDPRLEFVTVTAVTVSPDLSHATARVSIMGTEQELEEALRGLEHARGFLRSLIARSAELRITPELHFSIDRGLEHAQRIDQLLNDINQGESPR